MKTIKNLICPVFALFALARLLRIAFISVGVLFAITRVLAVETDDGVLSFNAPSVQPHSTFISFDPPGSTSTFPSAITPSGVIIGSYFDASGVTHGFLRTRDGVFTTFDVPSSTSTTATSITPGGVMTGWYFDAVGTAHGFIRDRGGSITSFDAPPGSSILGSIYNNPSGPPPSINPSGAIAGTYVDPSFVEHGFLRTADGTFTTVDFPGAFFTEVLAINPAGEIVGDFCNAIICFQGFLRTPDGTFTIINANAGIPSAVNPAGAITGTVLTGSAGYLQSPNGTFTVFNAPGSTFTVPIAINPSGAITGSYFSDTLHGFVRAPDGTIATFDPPGSTFTLAAAINPSGDIAGTFIDVSGVVHGFLRTP